MNLLNQRLIKKTSRGQTVLETFFVFSSLLFVGFVMMNLNVTMYTKNVASYAAFMAARSYQVYGDHQDLLSRASSEALEVYPKEIGADGNEQNLLEDERALTIIRTAEDIMTCALPWVSVSDEDKLSERDQGQDDEADPLGCLEGKRKYEDTNINRQLTIFRFDSSSSPDLAQADTGSLLEKVESGYREANRDPLRYAILKLQYKNKLLFNIMGAFDRQATLPDGSGGVITTRVNDSYRNRIWHAVHVPLLLNPGAHSGVEIAEDDNAGSDIDERVELEEDDTNAGATN